MQEVDVLVTQTLVELRERVLKSLKEKHPYLINMIETVLGNKENRVGLLVTEQGKQIGEYTFYLKGIHVDHTETGKLDSLVKHPLLDLTLKPYAIMEKTAIEAIIADDRIVDETFPCLMQYLPDITIKFMR